LFWAQGAGRKEVIIDGRGERERERERERVDMGVSGWCGRGI
jgi:hypothetical protein